MKCPVEDDNGVECQNEMTPEELEQDGYCARCACLLSDWWTSNGKKRILFTPVNTE